MAFVDSYVYACNTYTFVPPFELPDGINIQNPAHLAGLAIAAAMPHPHDDEQTGARMEQAAVWGTDMANDQLKQPDSTVLAVLRSVLGGLYEVSVVH